PLNKYNIEPPIINVNSFIPIAIKIQIGINSLHVKLIKTAKDINLSAIGSSTLPTFVIKLYFLAIYPSNISDIPATINISPAQNIPLLILEKNTLKYIGTNIILKIVIRLAIFIYHLPLLSFNHH